jgi:hypothetical protein
MEGLTGIGKGGEDDQSQAGHSMVIWAEIDRLNLISGRQPLNLGKQKLMRVSMNQWTRIG